MPLLLSPLTPIFDLQGRLAFGAFVHLYLAGTSEPASGYVDAGLSVKRANPIPTERGVLPPTYAPGGSYRILAVSETGDVLWNIDNVVLVDPFDDDEGGNPTDPTAVFSTGDLKHRYGTGPLAGWARLNGRTIGSANSAGTERANDDTHDLFVFLWQADANLAVSGGRGANAEEDWAAVKTIALPSAQNRTLVGLAGMGGPVANRLAGAVFDFGNPDVLGSYGGRSTHTLTAAQMPAHAHTASVNITAAGNHSHTGTAASDGAHSHNASTANAGNHSHSATSSNEGAHSHTYATATSKIGTADSGAVITNLWNGPNDTATTTTEPNHNHTISVASNGAHNHDVTVNSAGNHTHSVSTVASGSHTHVATATVNASTGGGGAHNIVQPFLLSSIYIKL